MELFAVIADPTRRQVLEMLRSQERAAGEITEAFPHLTQPAVSRQLRVLREAGLVRVRRDRQRRIYSLRPEGLRDLDAWIAMFRPFWEARLDALGRHLDRTNPRRRKR